MFNLHSSRATLGLFLSLSLLSGCKIEVKSNGKIDSDDLTFKAPTLQLGPVFTCSAQLSPQVGGSVNSGVEAPISVKASGGNSPYQILDTAIAFDSTTIVARTYQNTGTSSTVLVDTVTVKDNLGLITQCNFLVTVNPAGTPPSSLACNLVATPSSPAVNQSTVFAVTAQGGVAPYQFIQFVPGTQGTITSALSPISSVQANATATYSTAGLRSATATIRDNAGTQVICARSVDVAALPTVSMIASPSTAVVFGNAITLTATPSAFSSAPTYVFTTSRAGVSIVQNGNVATVTSATAQSNFNVVVTATKGSQTATSTITLAFLNPTTLPCTLTHTAGTYYTGDTILFSVAATSGEALEITEFSTQSDVTVVSSTNSSKSLKYSVAGTKNVTVKARSIATGALCQSGAYMSDSVVVNATQSPALTCSGVTNFNPSYTWEWFKATATISGGQGLKWVETISITKNGNSFNAYSGEWIDSNSAWLNIYTAGTYLVRFNLKDTNGNTGSCTTTHVVWY